jgi:hypothetical protein
VTFAWPAGSATGVGSLPGRDIAEAQRLVLGELPDLPHLPELPARGPGADLIGRAGAFLVDLPIELYAARWRVANRPGRDIRVARDYLERDLDTLTDQAAEYAGTFKIQAAGVWTLAAAVELPVGGPVLRDPGATRDLVGSLAEGLRAHVAGVRARLPQATVVVQVDEPSLPAVLAGRIPTESGLGTLRPVEPATVRDSIAALVRAVDGPVVVHCCAAGVPYGLLRDAGVAGVSVDLDLVGDLDALGEVLDAGIGLFAGAVSPLASPVPGSDAVASRVLDLWRKLGFPLSRVAEQVVVTPSCGLAGTPNGQLRPMLAAIRDAGRRLRDAAA